MLISRHQYDLTLTPIFIPNLLKKIQLTDGISQLIGFFYPKRRFLMISNCFEFKTKYKIAI